MKITNFDVTKIQIPIKSIYRMGTSAHRSLRSIIVRIYSDEGIVGVGEAHQGVPTYTPETIDTMHAIVSYVYGPKLIGRDIEDVEAIHRDLTAARKGNNFARCGVEIAIFDALAKSRHQSINSLLGGSVRSELKLAGGMGISEPEHMADQAEEMVKAGFETIKIKIGSNNLHRDLDAIRSVRNRIGENISLRVDANASLNIVDALKIAKGCADCGVEHLEQPLPRDDLEGMARIRQLGAVPILADESVETPEDAYRVISAGAADAIKIKISKVGGYINARKIINIAESSGIRIILGQGICSSIEAAAEAHLGCAYDHIFGVGEMVGPAKLVDDVVTNPVDLSRGTLTLPRGIGHGMELSEGKLTKYAIPNGLVEEIPAKTA